MFHPYAKPCGRPKKAKAKKPKKDNFFEKLKVDQLQSLLIASDQPKTGIKAALVQRLLQCNQTATYADEARSLPCTFASIERGEFGGYRSGHSIESLKQACRDQLLCATGTKYELVLRLVQHASGIGTPKAAGNVRVDESTGVKALKQRAQSMRPADLDKLIARVYKHAFPADSVVDKWSNFHSKYHLDRVVNVISSIIAKESIDKKFVDSNPLFALEVCEAAWSPLATRDQPRGWGYCHGLACETHMVQICQNARPLLDEGALSRHLQWISFINHTANDHGHDNLFGTIIQALAPAEDTDETNERGHGAASNQ